MSVSAASPSGQHLSISGMSCAGCVAAVENTLRGVPGVVAAQVNFADRSAQVSGAVTADTLIAAVRAAGYDAAVVDRVLRLVRISEWKRHQAAPGPKVSRRAFGRERRYPISNGYKG